MKNIDVSICVFAYDKEKYIVKCLESILMQKTQFNTEIVIGEDYSTDKTREICQDYKERYPDKITILDRKSNLGQIKNYYDTLKHATGKYIALMDADDYWIDPLKIEKQVSLMENNYDISICFHNAFVYDFNHLIKPRLFNNNIKNPSINNVIETWLMATSTIVYRNQIEFPDWVYNTTNPDLLIQLLISTTGAIEYINEPMGIYLSNDSGLTFNKDYNPLKNTYNLIDLFTKYNDFTNFKHNEIIIKKINNLKKTIKYIKLNNKSKFIYRTLRFLELLIKIPLNCISPRKGYNTIPKFNLNICNTIKISNF